MNSVPDSNYSDATISKYFAATFVSDQAGNYLYRGMQKELTGSLTQTTFSESLTYVPTQTGKVLVGGVIVETHTTATYNFATNSWTWAPWSTPVVIADDTKVVQVNPIAQPPAPPSPIVDWNAIQTAIQNFFNSLICGIKTLFGQSC